MGTVRLNQTLDWEDISKSVRLNLTEDIKGLMVISVYMLTHNTWEFVI